MLVLLSDKWLMYINLQDFCTCLSSTVKLQLNSHAIELSLANLGEGHKAYIFIHKGGSVCNHTSYLGSLLEKIFIKLFFLQNQVLSYSVV